MSRDTALLTFSIGPVHAFIAQARRLADLWAGSYLLSHLIRQAVSKLREHGGEMVFPYVRGKEIPDGIPNRFVCRVPAPEANVIAGDMVQAVREGLNTYARGAALRLAPYFPFEEIWREEEGSRQTDHLLDIAWSWVPETDGYAAAALAGARRFDAVRRFRPFSQTEQLGEKCAICGERTALPDGDRHHVREAWEKASKESEGTDLERFLRLDQTRLCLVCATKRLFPYIEGTRRTQFHALDRFQPDLGEPYLALVMMDGDRMGRNLSLGPAGVRGGDLERFHREVSEVLTGLAQGLRLESSPDLNLAKLGNYEPLGERPQLLYAGGDDVLFVCDPRDALALVDRLRKHYLKEFEPLQELVPADVRFTVSAAVLFAHPAHPAGLLLRDVEKLLNEVAKERMKRNAVAVRLAKRSGPPVDVAFKWDEEGEHIPEEGWASALDGIIKRVHAGELSSGQTFNLRLEEKTLLEVFEKNPERWRAWLADRLSRNEGAPGRAEELSNQIVPFFVHEKPAALRIARFLGREVHRGQGQARETLEARP